MFIMTAAMQKLWIATLAVGGMALSAAVLPAPAGAASCPSSVPLSSVLAAAPYTCSLGSVSYSLNIQNSWQDLIAPGAQVFFLDGPTTQKININNLNFGFAQPLFLKSQLVSPVDEIISFTTDYTYNPLSPGLTPGDSVTPPLPVIPTIPPTTIAVDSFASPVDAFDAPTVTAISFTITKTPAPLPIAGAALTYGFARKLRRRVKAGA